MFEHNFILGRIICFLHVEDQVLRAFCDLGVVSVKKDIAEELFVFK